MKKVTLCFNSAKKLTDSEYNMTYICASLYRPPELFFGEGYTEAIVGNLWCDKTHQIMQDLWALGCKNGKLSNM